MDCKDCPYKEQIEKNAKSIIQLNSEFTIQDKTLAVFQTEIRTQYKTILDTIIEQGKIGEKTRDRVIELEKREVLNEYKTNKAVSFIDKLTPSKIVALAFSILTLLIAINQLFIE